MANSSKLSEDMVVEILSRLPPKSLMRFKCVRKSWRNLTSNPTFVAKHLSNSDSDSSTGVVVKHSVFTDTIVNNAKGYRKKDVLLSFLKVCNDVTNGFHDSDKVEDLRVVHPSFTGLYYNIPPRIVCHCDGIICLNFSFYDKSSPHNHDIVLFNPAIKESELLPESCLCLPPQHEDHVRVLHLDDAVVGFGYDFKAKTYKVVRIVCESPEPGHRAEVYTLGADSWREIKWDVAYCSIRHVHVYFKGFSYWCSTNIRGRDTVLSFDMGEELFHIIPAPDDMFESNGCTCNSLAVWNESVALFSYHSELDCGGRYGYVLDIWVMYDSSDKVKKSRWSAKLLTIKLETRFVRPLTFWKSDELLMASTDGHVKADGRVVSYNLGTRKLKYLPIDGFNVDNAHTEAVVYVESIISVKRENKKLKGIEGNRLNMSKMFQKVAKV